MAQIGIALNKMLYVGALRVIDDLHGRIVLHQRKIAVHHVRRLADRLRDKFARGAVIVRQHLHQRRILCRQRLFLRRIVNRPRGCFAIADLPAASFIGQHQIHHAEMIAPHAGHHRRNAVQRAFLNIGPFDGGELLAGKDGVCMTKENRVDAFDLAEVVDRVLRHCMVRLAAEAGVRDRHHQIRTLGAHLRYIATRGFGDVFDAHFALQVGFVPHHNLRRREADKTDLQLLRLAVAIRHLNRLD